MTLKPGDTVALPLCVVRVGHGCCLLQTVTEMTPGYRPEIIVHTKQLEDSCSKPA